jgi:tetratricopeptide (TPR) repeat protein
MLLRLFARSPFVSCALLALFATALPVRAQDGSAARSEARERFDRGLTRFEQGDHAGALAEFERAQALVPNEFVLFNIGLVYAAMNRPVEATGALDRVLREPGKLSDERLARARSLREQQSARVAELEVSTNAPAQIEVDGVQVGATPLAAPLRIASGAHVLSLLAPGHLPLRRELTIASGARASLSFELIPSEARLAHIAIASPLPGAEVFLDDQRVGRTPLPASIAVAPGRRVIALRREGYRAQERVVDLDEGSEAQLEMDLQLDPGSPLATSGQLTLLLSETGAQLAIDGRAHGIYIGRVQLPAGPHRIRIDRAGFEPDEREVVVQAGDETRVDIALAPTPETRLAHVDEVRTQKLWARMAIGAGLAFTVAGGALFVWTQTSIPDLQRELDAARADYMLGSKGECDTASDLSNPMRARCEQRIADADDELAGRETLRIVGGVAAGVGLAGTALGIVLLLSADDEHKYDRAPSDPYARRRLQPSVWATANGAGLSVRGAF